MGHASARQSAGGGRSARGEGPGGHAGSQRSRRSSRPTMRDIAAAVGTSAMTVSRALNGEPGVSRATAERVFAAAAELGFRRNDLARSLRRGGGTGTVGLVLERSATRFYSSLITGVQDVAVRHDALVITASSHSAEREEAILLALSRSRVDGLLIVPVGADHSFLGPEHAAGLPLVFVDRQANGIAVDCVVADDHGGGRAATAHLLAHGHRDIAVIGAAATADTVAGRVAGYHAAFADAGITPRPDLEALEDYDEATAERAVRALLAREPAPTALFTLNSVFTIAALRALTALGLRDRVAVIGFDDFDTATLLDPPVTVIHHDVAAVGRAAAELLFQRISGSTAAPQHVELATSLVARGSGEIPGPWA